MNYIPKDLPPEHINRSVEPGHKLIVKGLAILGFVGFVFYLLTLLLPPVLTKFTSRSAEERLGKILIKSNRFKTKEPTGELKEVWSEIKSLLPEDLQNTKLYVMDSKTENAFAAPGGAIYLTTEFLKNAKSKNEKVFVIAHELGHQHYRHPIQSFYSSLLSSAVLSLVGGAGDLSSFMLEATTKSFSRKQETMSDLFALDLVQKYSGNAAGAFDFFKRVHKKYGFWESLSGEIFSTHPMSKKRVLFLEKTCAQKFTKKACI